jgi:iron complex outermembrane receptor protein
MHPFSRAPVIRRAMALCAGALGLSAAFAQPVTTAAPASNAATSTTTIVITGNPLRNDVGAPASVLGGEALTRARGGTLGDTLSGLPGVAASGFGPQSSRPVIRGLDGDRIRLLDNGGAAVDASSLSFDHAAAIDPLVVERFEVLRGPAALLYGGNATGGVVNAIDNRVPRTALGELGGRTEVRFGGAADERAGAAVIEAGFGNGLNLHADVAGRRSSDLRVPRFTPPGEAPRRRVVNSAGDSRAGALGTSWADANGFVGVAVDSYRNDYGVTVEPDVTIDMQRDRVQLVGERRLSGGPLEQIEFNASRTRYRHQEIEGSGEVGTTFTSRGHELRVQAQHAALPLAGGTLRGVVGTQLEKLDFSALGEEAFVPGTRTSHTALFVLEQWQGPGFAMQAGWRGERVRVESDGDAPDGDEARFGAASQRRFTPASASLGLAWPLSKALTLSVQVGHTERAPTYYELYASGVHVATGAFEVGDASLGVERSRHAEIGVAWTQGHAQLKAQVYTTRFARYIALDATGNTIDEPDEEGEWVSLPEYAFRSVRARLTGLELEGRMRLAEQPWTLDLVGALDLVRGSNRTSGEPLARLPPLRVKLGIEASHGPWTVGATLRHLARQTRVPHTDVATDRATLVDFSVGWRQRWHHAQALWFARLDNAGDQLATNAVALRTARELSPLPGRSATLGLRVDW